MNQLRMIEPRWMAGPWTDSSYDDDSTDESLPVEPDYLTEEFDDGWWPVNEAI